MMTFVSGSWTSHSTQSLKSTSASFPVVIQRLMGIRVLKVNLKPMGLVRSYARFLALSICMGPLILGQLLVLVTPRRRALHDLMVRTVVVYTDVEADAQELADDGDRHAAD